MGNRITDVTSVTENCRYEWYKTHDEFGILVDDVRKKCDHYYRADFDDGSQKKVALWDYLKFHVNKLFHSSENTK